MHKLFSRILVPVAFNRNTGWLVEKSIQLANKFHCDLVLVCKLDHNGSLRCPGNWLQKRLNGQDDEMANQRLNELESRCRLKLNEGLFVSVVGCAGSWQSLMKEVVISKKIDLVVIGKNRRKWRRALISHININKLSQQTNCPVLAMARKFNSNHLQHIVVPVQDKLPVKKLSIATYLSLESSGCIYLMGNEEQAEGEAGENLIKAYQLLNEFGKLNVQCAISPEKDPATGVLSYARDIHADLIVVNSNNESRLAGLWNRLTGKYISKESEISVLTVTA